MSWSRVKHPSEVVSLGEEIKVFIIGVDKENRKVSLGMKQLVPDPWVNVSDKYQIGKNVTGVITRITTFGAFIKLEEGIEGLIHISQLSNDHVTKVENVVSVGDEVAVKVIKLSPEDQKIGLSMINVDYYSMYVYVG